jgi:hypothetical protein
MRVKKVLLQITDDDGTDGAVADITAFEKVTDRPEDLGLSIAEGKKLLAAVQQRTVDAQVASWMERHRCCEACGQRRRSKGNHRVVFLTLYGDVGITSPRLHRCPCQSTEGPATLSPLRALIPDYVAPECLYLEARWASLVPYAAAADLLADILPVVAGANATTLREHVLHVAERAETELAEERACFINGCAADWAGLPIPEGRIVVGLDGGYVRNWQDRKTNFEVIVGQSVPEDRDARYVGLVHGYDRKPKRRLFDVLRSQGLQPNQNVTFLTDGGEEIRALTKLVTPESEHVLDCWGGRPHGIECQSWTVSNQHRSRPCPRLSASASTRPRPSSPCTVSTKLVRRCCERTFAGRKWSLSSRIWRLPRLPWKRAAAPISGPGN